MMRLYRIVDGWRWALAARVEVWMEKRIEAWEEKRQP